MLERRAAGSRLLNGVTEPIVVRPAASRDELEQAYALVYTNYLDCGYIDPNPSGLRLTIFNAFPNTATFVAVLRGTVIATITAIDDTPAGLPMDEICHEELRGLREQGRHIVEVGMLADRRHSTARAFNMVRAMMKIAIDYAALWLRAHDICVTINPRHDRFYRDYLLLEQLGPVREYPSVRNNPAVPRRLILDRLEETWAPYPALTRHFLRNRTPMSVFESRYHMDASDLRYFLVEKTSLLRESPEGVVEALKASYLAANWDELLSWRKHRGPHE